MEKGVEDLFIDNIFIAVIVVGAIRGWWRGLIRTAADVAGLVTGYLLVWLFSAEAGAAISKIYNVPAKVSAIICGTAFILGASITAGIAGYFIKRHKVSKLDEEAKEAFLLDDSEYGSWVGIVQGILLSCFAALMLSLLPSENKVAIHLEVADSAFVDFMAPYGPEIMDSVMTEMLGDTSNAKIAAAVLSNPEGAQEAAKEIVKSEAVTNLVKSEDFRELLETGTVEEIVANQQIQDVLNDPQVLAAFGKLGISEDDLQLSPDDMSKIVAGYRDFMEQMNHIKGTATGGTTAGGIPGSVPTDLLSDPDLVPKLMKMLTSMGTGTSSSTDPGSNSN